MVGSIRSSSEENKFGWWGLFPFISTYLRSRTVSTGHRQGTGSLRQGDPWRGPSPHSRSGIWESPVTGSLVRSEAF